MQYKIYRLAFQGAVHFGKNSLEDMGYTFCADTLFSALCIEALKQGQEILQMLYGGAKNGTICLSDAFPYIGHTYFMPKPMKRIETEVQQGDSRIKKAYKKLKYIPVDDLEVYLAGNYDVLHAEGTDKLGKSDQKVSAAVRGQAETVPYRTGIYYFEKGNGLYVIAGYSSGQELNLLDMLFEALSYSGIGGRRSEGLGRFILYQDKIGAKLEKRLTENGKQYMTLSVSLPKEDELEKALDGAQYLLCRRSGFIASETYAKEQMRKKDLYAFQAGACFGNLFAGDVYNVAGGAGSHPVYRYAKPMFMQI